MLLVAENNVWICSLNNSGQIQSFASDGVTASLYSERRELVGITEGTGSTSSPSNPTKARQAWECGDSVFLQGKVETQPPLDWLLGGGPWRAGGSS